MFTEFDEQVINAKSRGLLKRTLVETYRLFIKGDETMGVLGGYEIAAIKAGVSMNTIEKWYAENLLY